MKQLRVYVAGKYSAKNTISTLQNIAKGNKVCAELMMLNFAPFCPWHDSMYFIAYPNLSISVDGFREVSLSWLSVSDCMLVISGLKTSAGVKEEIAFCQNNSIPVFYSLQELMAHREKLLFEENRIKELNKEGFIYG